MPLRCVVLLVTGSSNRVYVTEIDAESVSRRLARSAAYERRAFYDLQERGDFAGLAGRSGARDAAVATERRLLRAGLSTAERILEVRCPFPGDPRQVADALARAA